HGDEVLVQALRQEPTLGSLIDPDGTHPEYIAKGFEECGPLSTPIPSGWLAEYDQLPTEEFDRYGVLPIDQFQPPPDDVRRRGGRTVYEGLRLLISRGIRQKGTDKGKIAARLESKSFCFKDSIHGIRLIDGNEERGKLLLGILWSSLTRYYLWMTSGHWTAWHPEVKKELLSRIPIRLPKNDRLRGKVIRAVDKLRSVDTVANDLYAPKGIRSKLQIDREIGKLETELDEAIFDLYELTDAERDVVHDMCDVGLELFYRGTKSDAVKPVSDLDDRPSIGRRGDLPQKRTAQQGLDGYLDAFLEIWDAEVGPSGQFRWRVIRPSDSSPMLAVVFSTEDTDDRLPPPADSDDAAWSVLLKKFFRTSLHPFGSKRIYIDGMTRIVGENDIAIIKRNERRLWTRTAAREDAEATQLNAVHKQRALARERAV
ncbi:MAG: N-6 DNA methylase, partial [Planctomycetes bacterium]|nr:N-6 DNA methylase [Planctomycetota bacterium]